MQQLNSQSCSYSVSVLKVMSPEISLEVRLKSDLDRFSHRHLQRDSGS